MRFNHFLMSVTFQYRGLYHLDLHFTLIIKMRDLNQTSILIADIGNYEMHAYVLQFLLF